MICTKARIILWFDCNRKCLNCCNEYDSIIGKGEKISSFDGLEQYDEFLLTGGEPMLHPSRLINIINIIRDKYPGKKIYLYTALFTQVMPSIIPLVDGIHFTLHSPVNDVDIFGFEAIQIASSHYPEKSFRAYIDPRIEKSIHLYPSAWKRLEVKPWLLEGECPLPDGEKLFIYEGD